MPKSQYTTLYTTRRNRLEIHVARKGKQEDKSVLHVLHVPGNKPSYVFLVLMCDRGGVHDLVFAINWVERGHAGALYSFSSFSFTTDDNIHCSSLNCDFSSHHAQQVEREYFVGTQNSTSQPTRERDI